MSEVSENDITGSFKAQHATETLKTPAKTVRINFVRILENSERFIANKQMLNQEKTNVKMVRIFFGIFICPCHILFPSSAAVLMIAVHVLDWDPGPWFQRSRAELILKKLYMSGLTSLGLPEY